MILFTLNKISVTPIHCNNASLNNNYLLFYRNCVYIVFSSRAGALGASITIRSFIFVSPKFVFEPFGVGSNENLIPHPIHTI